MNWERVDTEEKTSRPISWLLIRMPNSFSSATTSSSASTESSLPDPILHAFADPARRDPLAPLVVSLQRRATVGDVDALARAAGRRLAERPLAPGTLVGLAATNGPGFLASLLALRRAGLAA